MEFIKGDSGVELELEVKDIDGVLKLTGSTVSVVIRDGNRVMTKTANIVNADEGICLITFEGDDLQNKGYYSYRATVTTQEGNKFSSDKYFFEVKE